MSTDIHEPRPFDCPDCGHHHKADLHGMVGHPEVHGKVPCAKCGKTLWLSLDDEGEAIVELYEEHLHEAIHQERVAAHEAKVAASAAEKAAAAAGEPAGGGGPSLVLTVIAAALVALAVSLAMAGPKGGGGGGKGQGNNDARIEAMAADIQALKVAPADPKLLELGREIQRLEKQLGEGLASVSKSAGGDPAVLKAIHDTNASLTEAVAAVKASYKSLHGRIEGNYTALRQLDKRVKKLETP